jgi:hypothetical protein
MAVVRKDLLLKFFAPKAVWETTRIFTRRHRWSALEKRILIGCRNPEQCGTFKGLVFDCCDFCIRKKRQMAGYGTVAGTLHF